MDFLSNIAAVNTAAYSSMIDDSEDIKRQAWLKKREGKFTSSNIYKLMTYQDKDELPKGALTYIEEVAVEILTGGKSKETFCTPEMERGNEMELKAVERFEKEKRLKCKFTGSNQEFIEKTDYFGGTPDGITRSAIIEIKCPKSKTHLFYKRFVKNAQDLKKHKPEYYWQIQANMYCTGKKKGFFISYDDRFEDHSNQIVIVEVNKNDKDTESLKKRLSMANDYKNIIINGY